VTEATIACKGFFELASAVRLPRIDSQRLAGRSVRITNRQLRLAGSSPVAGSYSELRTLRLNTNVGLLQYKLNARAPSLYHRFHPVFTHHARLFAKTLNAAIFSLAVKTNPKAMDTILNVLVAEDNYDDAFILQRAFKACGLYRPAHIVPDGESAIAYLHGDPPFCDRTEHPFPDILILDLKMPRGNGFDVLEWINKNPDYRVIPAIVWSASADRRDGKHAFCLGAHAYLCKPSDYESLIELCRGLFTFWTNCEKPGVQPFEPTCDAIK
jgi:CheY-like chemotaxis protein